MSYAWSIELISQAYGRALDPEIYTLQLKYHANWSCYSRGSHNSPSKLAKTPKFAINGVVACPKPSLNMPRWRFQLPSYPDLLSCLDRSSNGVKDAATNICLEAQTHCWLKSFHPEYFTSEEAKRSGSQVGMGRPQTPSILKNNLRHRSSTVFVAMVLFGMESF